jgi:hypothetical protein
VSRVDTNTEGVKKCCIFSYHWCKIQEQIINFLRKNGNILDLSKNINNFLSHSNLYNTHTHTHTHTRQPCPEMTSRDNLNSTSKWEWINNDNDSKAEVWILLGKLLHHLLKFDNDKFYSWPNLL